jgi:hypothetical protein
MASSATIALLYAHEHVPDISPENTPDGIWWESSHESYVCRKNDPNFKTLYWKYQYQIGGFKLSGRDWLAQVGEGQVGERVFLQKRNGQVCFVRLTSLAFEDDDSKYFHIEFLRNEFDGEYLFFESGSESESSEASSESSEASTRSASELTAAVALMQLRAKPFLEQHK